MMDLSPGWAPLHSGEASYTCASVAKQYNLVPAKVYGKVTTGLVESNGSLPPGL